MLNGKHIVLKPIEETDLEKLRDWRNSKEIRIYTREYRPLNMLRQKKWYESLGISNNIMFTICNSDGVLGCCGLTYIDWKNGHGEISIYIGKKDWQNRGIASETVNLLLKYGFAELRLHRIYACIYSFNNASIKLFERCGFQHEGKHRQSVFYDGVYHDEFLYSILSEEYEQLEMIK